MIGLAIAGLALKGIGALVSAAQNNAASRKEDEYNQSQFDITSQQMDLAEDSLGRQRQQIEMATNADLRNMENQRAQTIGARRAMAGASGVTGTPDQVTDYQNDLFTQGIQDRQTLGELQLQDNADQLADLGLQRQSAELGLQFGIDQNKRGRTANWVNAGFQIGGAALDFVSGGYDPSAYTEGFYK
jgi:hypothetical protein